MQVIKDQEFGGERPLYTAHDLRLENVTIHLGESSIKESGNIEAQGCRFEVNMSSGNVAASGSATATLPRAPAAACGTAATS